MKRKLISFLLVFYVVFSAWGMAVADPSPSIAKEPIVLRIATNAATGQSVELGLRRFSELVEARTNGEVKIAVYPDSVLGDGNELLNQCKLGTIDMVNLGSGSVASIIPEYNITSFYYAWKNDDHMRTFFSSNLIRELNERYLKQAGVRIISSNWEQGYRHLVTKRPVNTLDDLRGMKIRVPQLEIYVAAWKALGANPTPMALGEVYTALQQNVVDAIELPLDWIIRGKYYEQAKYVVLTAHLGYPNQIQINEKSFQKLSTVQQEILVQAANEAGEYSSKTLAATEDEMIKELKANGVTILPVNRAEFANRVYTIIPQFERLWGPGFWQKVQDL
jgi:tripartite ATP-independent transporter DctP family solute receptor